VCFSTVELIASPPEFISGTPPGEAGVISALRCFRLFRIFKLSKEWKSMHELLEKFVATFWDVSNVAFIFVLLIYIFTLLGMQLYANTLKFNDGGCVAAALKQQKNHTHAQHHIESPWCLSEALYAIAVSMRQVQAGDRVQRVGWG